MFEKSTMFVEVTNSVKVLIVDDEPDITEIFAYIINRIGLQVRTASSVDEALSVIATWSPDIIISDYHMPLKNGGDLLTIVQELFTHIDSRTKFIFITGDTTDIENDSRCEGTLILKKPVKFSLLEETLLALAYPHEEKSHELLPIEATGT
jgi:DNA-binding NtrC family response regulator